MGQTLQNGPQEAGNPMTEGKLAQAWLVLLLAILFGLSLAAVQANLSGIIAENQLNETLDRIPELVWGDRAAPTAGGKQTMDIAPASLDIEKNGTTVHYGLFRVNLKKNTAGWVVKAAGRGYADKIELLIGLDADAETITGLYILEQKETPGLGANITLPGWRNQFVQQKTDKPLTVGKGKTPGDGVIDAVTGATISSRSVAAIVNRTIGDIKGRLTPAELRFSERRM